MPELSSFPAETQTPLMKQYWELKAQVPNSLLLFRMGDFYELFADDAVEAARILEITLTTRERNKTNPMPMAGVPHHSVQTYIQKLLKAGKKVAIGEQLEDPDSIKGNGKIVQREIVRIFTPGIQFDFEGSDSNYLCILLKAHARFYTLACLDASTGEVLLSDPTEKEDLLNELTRLPIRHLLYLEGSFDVQGLSLPESILVESLPKNYLSVDQAKDTLKNHYELENLSSFISSDTGVLALGILLVYVHRTQHQERLSHLRLPEPLKKPKSLILGPNTAQHLDLPDLFDLINQTGQTCSALGNRQLKKWLFSSLISPIEISERQKAIRELVSKSSEIEKKGRPCLKRVYDLERICGRINTGLANPRDTLALGQSLFMLEELETCFGSVESSILIQLKTRMSARSAELSTIAKKILKNQREEAPITTRDGGIFKIGAAPELDRLISLNENGQKWLIELETREREKTGIPSLKVRYNRVFGYYIEITQSHLKNVPSHYQRKQTMVGAERFFTEELKKFEEDILSASTKQKVLEQEMFHQLLQEIQEKTASIMEMAQIVGQMDALLSLSVLARGPGWVFPTIDESTVLEIHAGRHPLVDQAKKGEFVPNDVKLSPDTQLTLLITGPNMGGKSTLMRQVALIILLGQMGSPVPASAARWGVVSSLYTRIGAHDSIVRGKSTFMVEMSELAHILHHANERSLIVLDEIGRGTSTYDGISVAWSTLEWICNKIKARTLFATHYHELIHLAQTLPLLRNAHMAVEGGKVGKLSQLRFLYELRDGPTNESFGIHVAQLAGLPKPVVDRAWKILLQLETQNRGHSSNQLSLFSTPNSDGLDSEDLESASENPAIETLLQELENANINEMSPLQALNWIAKLQDLYQAPQQK